MKSKTQTAIGLFVAIIIGIGGVITTCMWGNVIGYGRVAGAFVPLVLVIAYITSLIIKKHLFCTIILISWSFIWIVSAILVLKRSFVYSRVGDFLDIVANWPVYVYSEFFDIIVFKYSLANMPFCTVLFVLVTVPMWIGLHGLSPEKPLTEQNEVNNNSSL